MIDEAFGKKLPVSMGLPVLESEQDFVAEMAAVGVRVVFLQPRMGR